MLPVAMCFGLVALWAGLAYLLIDLSTAHVEQLITEGARFSRADWILAYCVWSIYRC